MKVASILKVKGTTVETTPPRTSIATSARLLRDKHIGALVVSEDGIGVLGIITERDIVHGLADRGPSLLDLPVSLVMTRAPVTCTPDDDIQTVRSEEHTSELQSQSNLVCRLLLEKKKKHKQDRYSMTQTYVTQLHSRD